MMMRFFAPKTRLGFTLLSGACTTASIIVQACVVVGWDEYIKNRQEKKSLDKKESVESESKSTFKLSR